MTSVPCLHNMTQSGCAKICRRFIFIARREYNFISLNQSANVGVVTENFVIDFFALLITAERCHIVTVQYILLAISCRWFYGTQRTASCTAFTFTVALGQAARSFTVCRPLSSRHCETMIIRPRINS